MRNISSSLQRCPGCGAMVSFGLDENKTVCPFCGVELFDEDKSEKDAEAKSLLQRAYDYEAAGDIDKALRLCEKALDADASNTDAKQLHARLARMITRPNLKISCRSEGKRKAIVRVSVDGSKWMTVSGSSPVWLTLQPGEHSLFFRANRDYERTIFIKDSNTNIDASFVMGNSKNRIDISGDLEKDSKPHKKRPIYKQWWVYLVGGLLILALIGAITGEDEQPEEPISTNDIAVETELSEEPTATVEPSAPEYTPEPAQEPEPETTVETVKGYVNADSLRLRAEPNTESDILGEYEYGQSVEIIEESGEWYKVNVGDAEGYMSAEYVGMGEAPERQESPTEDAQQSQQEPAQSGKTVYITKTGSKYHYNGNCGNGTYYPVSMEEASHLKPCEKCVY